MITLWELYRKTLLPMVDMETGKKIDGKVALKIPDAMVNAISCDSKYNILVEYEKEPEDAKDV